ncbi:MAG: Sua5 YciO YrdC YwlC family protein [Campylobacteraceae bacterium]
MIDPKSVFLAQSDTTVGFLSQDRTKLNRIKQRDENKPCIVCVSSLHVKPIRVSKTYKNLVRRSYKTTFILQNGFSFRVVKDELHKNFIRPYGWFYSTSANKTNEKFDIDFAKKNADIIVEDERGFFEAKPSVILKIGKKRVKKIR